MHSVGRFRVFFFSIFIVIVDWCGFACALTPIKIGKLEANVLTLQFRFFRFFLLIFILFCFSSLCCSHWRALENKMTKKISTFTNTQSKRVQMRAICVDQNEKNEKQKKKQSTIKLRTDEGCCRCWQLSRMRLPLLVSVVRQSAWPNGADNRKSVKHWIEGSSHTAHGGGGSSTTKTMRNEINLLPRVCAAYALTIIRARE